jgi:hypothetical protein
MTDAALLGWYESTLGVLGALTATPREQCEDALSVAAVLELPAPEDPAAAGSPGLEASGSAAPSADAGGAEFQSALRDARQPPIDVLSVLEQCSEIGATCTPWPVLRLLLACQIRRAAEDLAGAKEFPRYVRSLLEWDDINSQEVGNSGSAQAGGSESNLPGALSAAQRMAPFGGPGDGGALFGGADALSGETQSPHVDMPMSSALDENPTLLGVLDVLDSFTEAPFTLQRLCELALDYKSEFGDPYEIRIPSDSDQDRLHGTSMDKLVFALDRALRVRSTVATLSAADYAALVSQLEGSRETGAEMSVSARREAYTARTPIKCTLVVAPPPIRRKPAAALAEEQMEQHPQTQTQTQTTDAIAEVLQATVPGGFGLPLSGEADSLLVVRPPVDEEDMGME